MLIDAAADKLARVTFAGGTAFQFGRIQCADGRGVSSLRARLTPQRNIGVGLLREGAGVC